MSQDDISDTLRRATPPLVRCSAVDLSSLIAARRRSTGDSLRAMEARARRAGYRISRSTISAYERGKITTQPSRKTVQALAAALDVTYEEVAAAASEQFGLGDDQCDASRSQRAQAWLRLTADRTDEEVQHLLKVVEEIVRFEDRLRKGGSQG